MVLGRFKEADGFEGVRGLIALLGGLVLYFVGRELIFRAAFVSAFSETTDPMYYVWFALMSISLGVAIGGPLWYWFGKPIRVATVDMDTRKANISSNLSLAVPGLIILSISGFMFTGGFYQTQSYEDPETNFSQQEVNITTPETITVSMNTSDDFGVSQPEENVSGSIRDVSRMHDQFGDFGLQVRYQYNATTSFSPTIVIKDGEGNIVGENSPMSSPAFVSLPQSKQTNGGSLSVELINEGTALDSQNITFEGADLSIENFELATENRSFNSGYTVEEVRLSLRNEGDTPARVSNIDVQIGDQISTQILVTGESIQPGSETEFQTTTFSEISGGEYDVSITVSSNDATISKLNTTATVSD